MSHECHAEHCGKEIPPRLFMCPKHWKILPSPMQSLIWKYYVNGQEVKKNPTMNYLMVAEISIILVFCLETGTILENETVGIIGKIERFIADGASKVLAISCIDNFDNAYARMREAR